MSKNNSLDIDKAKESALSAMAAPATNATQIPAQAVAPSPEKAQEAAPEPAKDGKEFVSAGKKIHNEITYRGVDWLVNSAVGVTFAYIAARTKVGKKYFSEPVAKGTRAIMRLFTKNPETIEKGAEGGMMFASIMAGGTAIIPVMMTLENKKNKKGIIKWLDEKWYGKEAVANDPKFQESYDAIDQEPHKSFGIGMASRFAALAPLIAITMTPSAHGFMGKQVYDRVANVSKWVSKKVGIKPSEEMLTPILNAKTGEKISNWDFLHHTIGFDVGLTFFYSFLHEAAYKAFAKLGMKETDTDKQAGQQYTTSGAPITSPASFAVETSTVENTYPLIEETKPKQSFASKVKPKAQGFTEPSELHTKRLAAQDKRDEASILAHNAI